MVKLAQEDFPVNIVNKNAFRTFCRAYCAEKGRAQAPQSTDQGSGPASSAECYPTVDNEIKRTPLQTSRKEQSLDSGLVSGNKKGLQHGVCRKQTLIQAQRECTSQKHTVGKRVVPFNRFCQTSEKRNRVATGH
jgi:hypothetical protein